MCSRVRAQVGCRLGKLSLRFVAPAFVLACLGCGTEPVTTASTASPEQEPATAQPSSPPNTQPSTSRQTSRRVGAVSALGRLEPEGGVRRLGMPSTPVAIMGAIVSEVRVAVGDDVVAGQILAVSESAKVLSAFAEEASMEIALAERRAEARRGEAERTCALAGVSNREANRLTKLRDEGVVAEGLQDRAKGDSVAGAAGCRAAKSEVAIAEAHIGTAKARLTRAREEAERAILRAPADGRILQIDAHRGELVGPEGLLEFARVEKMYAIAEVYETDIVRVREGQRAVVSSSALPSDLTGRVELIRNKVQKQDETDTDPAARKDARVVEVEILLDQPELAARLINLQVEVVING